MNIFHFAKLSRADKEAVLRNHALFIEQYHDGEKLIALYFYNSFFIEAVIIDGTIAYWIPYQVNQPGSNPARIAEKFNPLSGIKFQHSKKRRTQQVK
jgi:hypothetical protein